MKWVKLKRGDDWGYVYYERVGADRGPAGTCNHRRDAAKWGEGESKHIRLARGQVLVAVLKARSGSSSVHDHGRSYTARYALPVAWVDELGVSLSLDEVDVLEEEWIK